MLDLKKFNSQIATTGTTDESPIVIKKIKKTKLSDVDSVYTEPQLFNIEEEKKGQVNS